jgi:hypothetical protein
VPDVDPDAVVVGAGVVVVELNGLLLFEHAVFRATKDASARSEHENRKN